MKQVAPFISTRQPIRVTFNIAKGETMRLALKLPSIFLRLNANGELKRPGALLAKLEDGFMMVVRAKGATTRRLFGTAVGDKQRKQPLTKRV